MSGNSVRIKAGFLPVRFDEFFREATIEKGRHILQHILQVEEIRSGNVNPSLNKYVYNSILNDIWKASIK